MRRPGRPASRRPGRCACSGSARAPTGARRTICRVASMPLSSGMPMSRTATSGLSSMRLANGVAAVAGFGDDAPVAAVLENLSQTLTQDGVVVAEQHAKFIHGSPPNRINDATRSGSRSSIRRGSTAGNSTSMREPAGALSMRTRPSQSGHTLANAQEPEAAPLSRTLDIGDVESDAVVFDRDADRRRSDRAAARRRRWPRRAARYWSALPERSDRRRVRSRRAAGDRGPGARTRRRSGGGAGSPRRANPAPRPDRDRRAPTDAGDATDRERCAARLSALDCASASSARAPPIVSMRRSATASWTFTALSACPTSSCSSRAMRRCSSSRAWTSRAESRCKSLAMRSSRSCCSVSRRSSARHAATRASR